LAQVAILIVAAAGNSKKKTRHSCKKGGGMARAPGWKQPRAEGPVVWWLRNDLRLEDNPVARLAASEAHVDGRACAAIFIFDPRFIDKSNYGRVTDPGFEKSIPTRKPLDFGNRKCCALRARFMLQCVRAVVQSLLQRGVKLRVCHALPEEVFGALPNGSLVVCQQEPVSVECTDVEDNVEAVLQRKGSHLWCEWGAMSLYHRDDMPFKLTYDDMPKSFTELGAALGWEDIWTTANREAGAATLRPPVAAPAAFTTSPMQQDQGVLQDLPGLLSEELLADDRKALQRLGYTDDEIQQAFNWPAPAGGEPEARAWLEAWLPRQTVTCPGNGDNPQAPVFWDLPVGSGPGEGHDALQWANLAKPDGWTRISHYLAVGCISAREVCARAAETPNFAGVVHRLMWRELHRLNAIRFGRRLFWLQGPGWVERPWSWDTAVIEAWKLGKTGVPYIDACMRELRTSGWLAYKGRKTTGYFLIFGLGVDWRVGAYHFEDVLLDYDCAMNYGNWVTVACIEKPNRANWGSEAMLADIVEAYRTDIEYKLSAEMANDQNGDYIRQWVPELRGVSAEFVHRPWEMAQEEMVKVGCVVGKDYPAPMLSLLKLSAKEEDWNVADADGDGQPAVSRRMARSGEHRVHPEDSSGRSYSRSEFLAFAASIGETEEYGENLWKESLLVPDIQKKFVEMEERLKAQEKELSALRGEQPDQQEAPPPQDS